MKNKILISIISFLVIFLIIIFILKSNTIETIINRIKNNVKMSEIETKVDYEIEKNGEDFNICFTIENQNGIEQIELQDINIECNNKEKVAIDRTLKENDIFSLNVKINGKKEKELFMYVASEYPIIHVQKEDETTKRVQIEYPQREDITSYYSIDNGQTWQIYTEEITVQINEIEKVLAKIEFDDGETVNKPSSIPILDKVYLYNLGDKNEEITNGYTFRVLDNTRVAYQDNPDNMYMYASSVYGVGYGQVELYSNNTINVDYYDKIYFDMDYSVTFGQEVWRCHFYYGLHDGKIIDIPGTNSSTGNIISMDITNLKGNHRPYFRVLSCSADKPVWCRIRAIYLDQEDIYSNV